MPCADGELGSRALHVGAQRVWIARDLSRIADRPAVFPQGQQVALVPGVDVESDLEAMRGAPRQLDELAELMHLEPVGAPADLDRPERPAPGRDRREAVRASPAMTGQSSSTHRLANGMPVDAAGRDRTVVVADQLADREIDVVSDDMRLGEAPASCQNWVKPGSMSTMHPAPESTEQTRKGQVSADVDERRLLRNSRPAQRPTDRRSTRRRAAARPGRASSNRSVTARNQAAARGSSLSESASCSTNQTSMPSRCSPRTQLSLTQASPACPGLFAEGAGDDDRCHQIPSPVEQPRQAPCSAAKCSAAISRAARLWRS